MIVYRCSTLKWSKDLSGTGASMYGGRWNNPGTFLLYTAENNILAALEIAIRIPLEQIGKDYVMIPLEVPDDADVFTPKLSKSWYKEPEVTHAAGDAFVKANTHLLMKVPSALISDAFNYLINPRHELISKVKVLEPRSILMDKRLADIVRVRGEKG
jgi:RES domain-containing protein